MSGALVAAAAALVWFGMVTAISFLEAPLKFRAPGITTKLGLGIGRIVFAALNACESALATVVAVGLLLGGTWSAGAAWLLTAIGVLAVQLIAVRPVLRRRTAQTLTADARRASSHAHWAYVGLEFVKAFSVITGALLLLSAT